nr:MAG TPA: hypothetical protein [Caudoviricetes sp.]
MPVAAKYDAEFFANSKGLRIFEVPKSHVSSLIRRYLYRYTAGLLSSTSCRRRCGTLASYERGLPLFYIFIYKLSDLCQSPLKALQQRRIVPAPHPSRAEHASTRIHPTISQIYLRIRNLCVSLSLANGRRYTTTKDILVSCSKLIGRSLVALLPRVVVTVCQNREAAPFLYIPFLTYNGKRCQNWVFGTRCRLSDVQPTKRVQIYQLFSRTACGFRNFVYLCLWQTYCPKYTKHTSTALQRGSWGCSILWYSAFAKTQGSLALFIYLSNTFCYLWQTLTKVIRANYYPDYNVQPTKRVQIPLTYSRLRTALSSLHNAVKSKLVRIEELKAALRGSYGAAAVDAINDYLFTDIVNGGIRIGLDMMQEMAAAGASASDTSKNA